MSVLGAFSSSLGELIVIRFIQGCFGAVLTPLSMSTLLDNFHLEDHGKALGWWGVGIMIAPIMGPTVGAFIAEHFTWRGVFFINLPFGILACLMIASNVPVKIKRDVKNFNYTGFLTIAISAGCLQYILDQGERLDWFDAEKIIIAALIAGIALYCFILNTVYAQNPFLDYRVLMDRNFCVGMVLKVLLSIILVSIVVLFPPFLIDLWNYPIITAGLVMAPRGVGIVLSVMVVGYLVKYFDSRSLMAFGMLLAAYSTWLMSNYTSSVTPLDPVLLNFFQGIGWSFLFVPLTAATFSTLNPRYLDVAAGLYGLVGNLGKSVGVSILVGFYIRNTQANRSDLIKNVSPFNESLQHNILPDFWSMHSVAGLSALEDEIGRQASIMAYTNDFRLLAFIILACLPLVLLMHLPEKKMKKLTLRMCQMNKIVKYQFKRKIIQNYHF